MPGLPRCPCKHPGCQRLATARDSYCDEHREAWLLRITTYRRTHDKMNRPGSNVRGYTSTWQKLRRIKLNTDAMCERCQHQPASVVHHIDGDAHNNRMTNLMSVCRSCHEVIHGRKRGEGGINL